MIYPETNPSADEVAKHYNELDQYYRQLWGEHIHHGYFKFGNETVQQATENLIDFVIEKGNIHDKSKVLDVGCGYGGTARYLTRKKNATVTALTLSKAQWQYARAKDPESSNPQYLLGDFLHNDMKEKTFDVVLSIESSEHMVDKPKFFQEIFRLLKPGGYLVNCAWLCKSNPTKWEVKNLLEPICREGRLPSLGSEEDYRSMTEAAGMQIIDFQDLSSQVQKTWAICAGRASKGFFSNRELRKYLLDKHSTERIFAKSLFRIWGAYHKKAMRYGVFTAKKP